jgi:hypothetical protein
VAQLVKLPGANVAGRVANTATSRRPLIVAVDGARQTRRVTPRTNLRVAHGMPQLMSMALREFTATNGTRWRVWDVRPESMHPASRAEDYLAPYLEGWLVFESADGISKCRLHPIPRGWSEASDTALEEMLRAAEQIRGERASPPHGRQALEEAEAERIGLRTTPSQARTFRFPEGRYWTIAEWKGGPSGRTVLRFASGGRSMELHEWPPDWRTFTDSQLADLLSRSFPREPGTNTTPHRRRATDAESR